MMKTYKSITVLLFIALSAFFFAGCKEEETVVTQPNFTPPATETSIRVIHMSYDAPAVDILIDDQIAVNNLSYGESSGYASLTTGTYNIKVVPAGATSPVVIEANLPIQEGIELSILAVNNLASIEPIVVSDNRSIIANKAKIRFIHASPDAPAVDIKLNNGNGPALFSNTSFKDATSFLSVDEGTYNIAVTPAGSNQEVVILGNVALENRKLYTVVANGTLNEADNYPFQVRVFVDNQNGTAYADLESAVSYINVVHASPDAPGVDLLLNNTIVGTNLMFPNNTGYLEVNSKTSNVKVNVTGTSTTAIEADLLFDAYKNYSIFAVDAVSNISALVIEDDLTPPAPGSAHVRFIHLSPDAPAVDITLTDGTVVFGNKSFKEFTPFTPLTAGTYDLQVRLAGTATVVLDLPGITVQDGRIYTVFAKGFVTGSGNDALGAEIILNNIN